MGVEQCGGPLHSDIRYALLPAYQGCGYILEAAKAVLTETFKAGKHSKIYGVALRENIPSLIVIKKLGMQLEPEATLYGDVEGLETYSIEKFV